MRAWIETSSGYVLKYSVRVALRVRAWIETLKILTKFVKMASPSA